MKLTKSLNMRKKLLRVIDQLNRAQFTGSLAPVECAVYDLQKIIDNDLNEEVPESITSESISKFKEITDSMAKTYESKNHDYGNSFELSLDEFGLIASVVRLNDKMNRIKSLIKKEAKVKDESTKDTLLDMANYAILTIMWMNKNQNV